MAPRWGIGYANRPMTAAAPVPSARASALFHQRFGAPPSHAAFAPGRVNLIGEHTDYTGGFVLPLAMDLGTFALLRPRADRAVRLASTLLPESDSFSLSAPIAPAPSGWFNYVRGVIADFRREVPTLSGFDLLVHSTLPAGGGLSSSAALEVSVATALEELSGVRLDPVRKALLCQQAEHTFAGTPCGIMDQFASTFGRAGHLLLIDCESQVVTPVPMAGIDAAILVFNTMVRHALNDGEYRARRAQCEEAAARLGVPSLRHATPGQVAAAGLPDPLARRARHVVTENARTLAAVRALAAGDWPALGARMAESHASLRDDFEVSCRELDLVVELAGRTPGVHGCRMTGGGFGGCCVALVGADQAEAITLELRRGYREATGIEAAAFVTRPSDGARPVPLAPEPAAHG